MARKDLPWAVSQFPLLILVKDKSFRWTELLLTIRLTFERIGGVIFYRLILLNEALDRLPIGDSFQASHKTLTLTISSFHPEDDVRRKPLFLSRISI